MVKCGVRVQSDDVRLLGAAVRIRRMTGEFNDKVMRLFAERLTRARERAGYKDAEEFAAILGVSGARYRYWERGESAPRLEMFTRICEALKVSPNYLLPLAIKHATQKGKTPAKVKRAPVRLKRAATPVRRNGGHLPS